MNDPSKRGIFLFVAGVVLGTAAGYLAGSVWGTPQVSELPAAAPVTRFVEAPVIVTGSVSVTENPDGITGGGVAIRSPGGGVAIRSPGHQRAEPEAPKDADVPLTPEVQALSQFMAVFDIEDPDAQTAAFQNMVAGITPANAAAYHKAWMSGQCVRASDGQEQMYNSHIGGVYGPSVVGVRDGTGPKDMMGAYSFVKDQFQGWIRSDPPSAEKWLDGLSFEPFRIAMESAWDEAALASQNPAPGGQ